MLPRARADCARLPLPPRSTPTRAIASQDIYDAKNAVDHLSGFNVCGRYLVVLYYQQVKMQKRLDTEREQKELAEMRQRLGLDQGAAATAPPTIARQLIGRHSPPCCLGAGDSGLDLASK